MCLIQFLFSLSSLQMDFYVIGLINRGYAKEETIQEVHQQLQVVKTQVCCDCNDDAWKICNKCSKLFCDSCFVKTHSFKVFDDHQLVASSSSSQQLFHHFYEGRFCLVHDADRTIHCYDCRKLVCLSCCRACSSHNVESIESEVNVVNFHVISEFNC